MESGETPRVHGGASIGLPRRLLHAPVHPGLVEGCPGGAVSAPRVGVPPFQRAAGLPVACSLAVAAFCGVVLTACTPGTYPVDLFAEMHYQPSQRLLEPDRRAPPPDAVPVTGRGPVLTFEQAGPLRSPLPNNQQTAERGIQVFKVNCAMCHGADGKGKSFIADRFSQSNAVPPVDFTSARVRGRSDGELYWIVTNGLGNMPAFGNLLTDDERWAVVQTVRGVQ